jgi:hypothetical protein
MKMTSRNMAAVIMNFASFWLGCSPSADDRTLTEVPRPAKILTIGMSGSGVRTFPGRVQAAQRFRVGGSNLDLLDAQNAALSAGFTAGTAVYAFLDDWAEVQPPVADLDRQTP